MIVKFDRVSKTLDGSLVTDNISFELPEGKMMALLGPNGAGKTTSIRLLLGLYKADSGTVKVFGQEVDAGNSAEIRKNIGVQCDGNVYENLTVYDNLKLWGEIYGMSGETLENRITEMLEFFKLEEKRDVLAAKLSKGMKQKVNLARAIIHTPRLLILDEPTVGLDPISVETVMQCVKTLADSGKVSVIMCTHLLNGLEEYADYVGIIQKGSLTQFGPVKQLIGDRWPQNQYRFKTSSLEETLRICSAYGNAKITKDSVVLTCINDSESEIISKIVSANIQVLQVEKIEHTIKDLYFSYVKE